MADFDLSQDCRVSLGNPRLVSKVFDATEQNLDQNETVALIDIPAKSYVLKVFWEVQTVEGAARNFAIGDGDDPDGYIASTSGNSLASGASNLALTTGTPNTVTGYSNGKYYSAADQLDLLAVTSGGLTGIKIKVSALIIEFA